MSFFLRMQFATRISSKYIIKIEETRFSLNRSAALSIMSEKKSSNHIIEGEEEQQQQVKESTIRKMTRLAIEYDAVNLSQGFPNEAPPMDVRMALAHAVLTGRHVDLNHEDDGSEHNIHYNSLMRTLSSMSASSSTIDDQQQEEEKTSLDVLNQYSPPMGRKDVRNAIAAYYKRFYNYEVDPENITVTLGATEAFACSIRSLGKPQDKAVVFEPFHELYPSQCNLFYLNSSFVTLRAPDKKTWIFDAQELEEELTNARMLLLNTPHNPTGKIFTREELRCIVDLCIRYNVYIVTDEIYEFMCYSSNDHILIPKEFPEVADLCLVCNSMGKSASATGWRLGWCLHPPHISSTYRGIHDQLAVMSPHPMQYAALTYLTLPNSYFNEELKEKYKSRVIKLAKTLQDLGFDVIFPEAAYYLFVKYSNVKGLSSFDEPMDAAMHLLKKAGVACVPGDNFYKKAVDEGKMYLRFAACRSEEDITEACARLQKYFQK